MIELQIKQNNIRNDGAQYYLTDPCGFILFTHFCSHDGWAKKDLQNEERIMALNQIYGVGKWRINEFIELDYSLTLEDKTSGCESYFKAKAKEEMINTLSQKINDFFV